MNISAVGTGYSTMDYGKLASGKRINTAADDAAGLTQVQKMTEQTNGYEVGASNAKDMDSLTKVTDGALAGIGDYLQSIRELSLKASNGLMTSSDKKAIQEEIGGYLEGIESIAKGTTFNTKSLLDGQTSLTSAVDGNGSTKDVTTGNATLKALGIDGYDVTGSFDLSRIDSAIDKVNGMRSGQGAASNALQNIYNYNKLASENMTAAGSRIEDLDMEKAISERKKNEVLDEYKNMMLKKQMDQESLVTKMLQ